MHEEQRNEGRNERMNEQTKKQRKDIILRHTCNTSLGVRWPNG